MRDAGAHLPGPNDADLTDRPGWLNAGPALFHQPLRLRHEKVSSVSCGPAKSAPRFLKFCIEFRQCLKKIGDKSVVRDLKDRRLAILVDGDDHF